VQLVGDHELREQPAALRGGTESFGRAHKIERPFDPADPAAGHVTRMVRSDPNDAVEASVVTVPDFAPDWHALFHVVKTIHRVSELARELSHQALVAEVHEAARDTEDDIEILGIRGARWRRGEEFLDEWRRWADEVMSDLASGSWPGAEGDASVTLLEPRGPRHETPNRRR